MKKAYKYRIYPTKGQIKLLEEQLEICRFMYNKCLEINNDSYEKTKESILGYKLINLIPSFKEEYPQLNNVYSQVLQNVAKRVTLAEM